MQILHLNNDDSRRGASLALMRLHQGLCNLAVESKILVREKTGVHHHVIAPIGKPSRAFAALRPTLENIPLSLYPQRSEGVFTGLWIPSSTARTVRKMDQDVVHLHWIKDFLRLEELLKMEKPIIWTLHDMWPFTGGCHLTGNCSKYQKQCGNCPLIGSQRERDLSRRIWERKKQVFQKLNSIFIAPSQWMADRARSSSLLEGAEIKVIPNGLDVNTFQPVDQGMARKLLGIDPKKRVIVFGSDKDLYHKNKGFHLLEDALQIVVSRSMISDLSLVIIGTERKASQKLPIPTHFLGRFKDDLSLSLIYGAADLLALPSLQESFGQVASEALSCGRPVVAFDRLGISDVIDHQKNGYLAESYQVEDFAAGLEWVLEDTNRWERLAADARLTALAHLDQQRTAEQHRKIYQQAMELPSIS